MEKFISVIKSVKGCQFFSMSYVSEVKLTKAQTAEIGGPVSKIVSGVFQFNYSYENAVNNRLGAVDMPQEFKAEPLKWGEWETPNKIIKHKGNLYLRYYGVEGQMLKVQYYINGKEANEGQSALIKAMTERKGSQRQTDAGLDSHQVIARCVAFANIKSININGEKFEF
jgi:hypothetical protein